MTDEQQLREALEAAVPEPPDHVGTGERARDRSRRTRQRRVGAAIAVAAVVAVGVPAARSIDTRNDSTPQITGTVVGSGRAACREVGRRSNGLGALTDTRVVDSSTAIDWLRVVRSPADPASVTGARPIDVCLFDDREQEYTVVAGAAGRTPVVVSQGRFDLKSGPLKAMQTLDRLGGEGAQTTHAPFACPSDTTPDDHSVSNALPSGSTGALLCYTDGTLYSPRRILSLDESDRLVTLVDSAPIVYVPPDVLCGGIPGFREYSIVFRYPTGTRVVREEMCRGLALGRYTRDLRVDLDVRLERLLGGRIFADLPACPSPKSSPRGVGDLRHLVAVRFCPAGESTGQVLTGSGLAVVRHWGAAQFPGSTEPDGGCPRPSTGWPHLTFVDTWGNAFTATVECPRHLLSVLSDSAGHPAFYPESHQGNFGHRLAVLSH